MRSLCLKIVIGMMTLAVGASGASARPHGTVIYTIPPANTCAPTKNPVWAAANGEVYGMAAGSTAAAPRMWVFYKHVPPPGLGSWSRVVLGEYDLGARSVIACDIAILSDALVADPSGALYGTVSAGSQSVDGPFPTGKYISKVFRLVPPTAGQTLWQKQDVLTLDDGFDSISPTNGLAGMTTNSRGEVFGVGFRS